MAAKLTIGGTVDGTNYEGYAEVEDVSGDVDVQNGELVVNGDLTSSSVTGAVGGKITFGDNATVGDDVEDMFTNGTATVTDVAGETFTFDSSEKAFVNEDVEVELLTVTAAAWWNFDSATAAKIPASEWLVYGDSKGWNCFDNEDFIKEVAENPSFYVTATLANGVEVADQSPVKLTSLAINGESVEPSWVKNDNNGVRSFNDNFARWGIHILTNDDENVSDTNATSIKSGDVITGTVELTLKDSKEPVEFTFQCTYGGADLDRNASAAAD